MLHSRKRLCALFLSGVMLLSQLPITALAEEYQPQDGQIASFEALPAQVAEQTVPLGTQLDELDLPETVTANVYHVREDVVIPVTPDKPEEPPAPSEPATEGTEQDAPTPEEPTTDAHTPEEPVTDAHTPEEPVTDATTQEAAVKDSGETVVTVATATEDIPVASWDSDPAYDGDAAGRYVFTPQFEGCTLAPGVQPPKITVTVEEDRVGYQNGYSENKYNLDDVQIIQGLIKDLGLEYGDDPENDWSDLVGWSSEPNDKRVIRLTLPPNLSGGAADLRGLGGLQELYCNNSGLGGLEVAGLSNLWCIECNGNQMSRLDLTGCTALSRLQADENKNLISYTGPNGYTATVEVNDSRGGRVFLWPSFRDLNEALVRMERNSGWSIQSVDPKNGRLYIHSGDAKGTVTFAEIPKPNAPTRVSASGGEEQATLIWFRPSDGAEPTGYEVTKDDWETKVTLGAGREQYTFTDLKEGNYTLKVRAVNIDAAGPEVSANCDVSKITVPGAPKDLSATSTGRQITLNWKSPDTGSAPTRYQVTISDWDHAVELDKVDKETFTYTFDGLANGTYTLMVRGVNKAGPGTASTVDCTVSDQIPPELSDEAAIRINDNDATVTFTSNEPGVYYILVSDMQERNPVIDMSGQGLPFVTGRNTIPVTNLTAGAKYVYIKAKDVLDNVTVSPLEVPIPASSELGLTIEKTEGGAPTLGTDYLYESDVLTILSDTPMTIANRTPQTATGHRIVVSSPNGANLTLSGVSIDVSAKKETAAFEIGEATGRAAVNVLLAGENTLTSGSERAGLQTQHGAKLTIDSAAGTGRTDGSLDATGGPSGAGIGGGYIYEVSVGGIYVTIAGGTVTGRGGTYGAGIGGGFVAVGGASTVDVSVTITGGEVNAWGNTRSAGIGSGEVDNASVDIQVTISGGAVTAKNSNLIALGGAGIGSGYSQGAAVDLSITITDGTVHAEGGLSGAGIGRGPGNSDSSITSTIEIRGGDVVAAGGQTEGNNGAGAGIGGGSYYNSTDNKNASGGTILIAGSAQVTASGGYGAAGIGGGSGGSGGSGGGSGGAITIAGDAQVRASSGGGGGAGIGGGEALSNYQPGGSGDIIISGNAVVFATAEGNGLAIGGGRNGNGIYGDSSHVSLQGGLVFQKETGTVYGDVTLPGNLEIPQNHSLIVSQGKTLTNGHTLTNQGVIGGGGVLTGDGTFDGGGEYKLRVSRTIAAPTAASVGLDSVTLNAMTASRGDGQVQYAVSSTNSVSTVLGQWQDSPVFTNLTPSTDYYFFARVTGSKIYQDVTSTGLRVKTMEAASYSLTASPNPLNFGSAEVGYSAPNAQTVTVTNTGNQSVTLNKPTSVNYTVGDLSPSATIAAGKQATFTVQPRAGLAVGNYHERLDIKGSESASTSVGLNFTVTAAPSYLLSATPDTLNFGSAEAGYSAPAAQTVTITNTGNQSITLTKPTSVNYMVGDLSPGGTIGAGGHVTFTVQPRAGLAVGNYHESLDIKGSDSASTSVELEFTVTAAPSNLLSATPNTLNFGSAEAGYSAPAAQTVTVTNTGNQSITLTKPTSANYTVGDFSPSATIAAGGHVTFTVQPKTGLAVGNHDEILAISGSGSVSASASVNLRFTVTRQSSGGGGGGNSGSGGNSGGSVTVEPSTPTPENPNPPTDGVVTPPATVDKDGNVKVDVSDKDIQNAIDKAVTQAKKDGTTENGISLSIDLSGLKTEFHQLPLTLSEAAYKTLVDAGVRNLNIITPQLSLSLDLETLKTIHANADGKVTIDAAQIDRSKLGEEAKTALGSRPAYDLTITSGGKTISQFGGHVALTLPYTLHDREQGGELQMVWLDGAGQVQYMTGSSYNDNQKAMLGRTNHFTVFGIAEKPAPVFTDITGHWAKDDILFVASRELLNGTAEQVFSPNGSTTRGMFVTALGRLAGIDPESYQTGRFTDVAEGSYHAPYVNWAASKGVVSGTTPTTFSPDHAITRQELATIMQNYAKAMGYELPITREAVTFSDDGSIASWAKDAVRAMQQAGVLMGKEGNRFDPTGTATRAEVSAVLHRYAELIIDPQTAQGWDRNDSGKWVYFVDGKAVTGERVIGGTTYHFDEKGQLTKIDAIAPEGKKYVTYKVQKDDTLWSIAEQHNCTVAEIVALNKALINDPNKILVGWELKIPQA